MIFRYARHTNNLEDIRNFYTSVLNFEILGEFKNHEGYDGIFVGKSNKDWHLEFTTSTEKVNHQFDEDDALVFYPVNNIEFEKIKAQIQTQKITVFSSKNPYWNDYGILIKDPDGCHIIISNQKIKQ